MSNQTYEHFFYLPTSRDASALAGDLQREGVIVPDPAQAPLDGLVDWCLMAYTDVLPLDQVLEQTDHFKRLALKHHGTYDGGGTSFEDLKW